MRRYLFFLLICVPALSLTSDLPTELVYMFPVSGSTDHNPQVTLILKTEPESADRLSHVTFEVNGQKSGLHNGSVLISKNTIIFKPTIPFALGEGVHVNVTGLSKPLTFHFSTRDHIVPHSSVERTAFPETTASQTVSSSNNVRLINGVAVPSDFPNIITTVHGETAPGRIFFAPTFFDSGSRSNYVVICENDGTPYFYRKYERSGLGSADFKVQDNGLLSLYRYIHGEHGFHIVMDEHFAEVDTFQAAHGYRTDNHEMLLLDNGHALLIAEDDRRIDMSKLVSGGNTNANVVGNHIQEVDSEGNVFWEWRSWDHLHVLDVDNINLKGGHIDYVHLNSIAIDYDGHYVLSLRNMSEMCKINSQTGEFIWRLGGVNNQFDSDEEQLLSHQHCAKPVPDQPDSYTIYDNGNTRSPSFTRAVEYKLDVKNKTAENVWQYRYDKANFQSMMGGVQRLPNGNTYIDWSAWPPLRGCEVDAENNLVFEIEAQGISSYRSYRFKWEGEMLKPYLLAENTYEGARLIFNKFGDTDVLHYIVYGGTSPNSLAPMDTTSNTYAELTNLENDTRYYFKVCAVNGQGEKSEFSDEATVFIKYSEPGENLLANGDFSDGSNNWDFVSRNGAQSNGIVKGGIFFVEIESGRGSESIYDIQVIQESFPIINGRTYVFEFEAWADANKVIEPRIAKKDGDYALYSGTTAMSISRQRKTYRFEFEMTHPSDYEARVVFNCGGSDTDCYFDNVSVKELLPSHIETEHLQPTEFALAQNYPNPFNATTTINFDLPSEQFVTLSIFDLRGRRVDVLLQETRQAGHHSVTFDASQLASGIFFYKLRTHTQTLLKKMILIK